jgi:hypothetical protein
MLGYGDDFSPRDAGPPVQFQLVLDPMKPTEQEWAELQARVGRLEARLAELGVSAEPARVPPPARVEFTSPPLSTVFEEPPLLPPLLPGPARPPERELPSTLWIAGSGAVIFLIGVIYFLTVSIQRGWVSPMVRVLGGISTGTALGFAAARMLRGPSRSLGVTLLAAATGTWTFAFYYGAQQANLFSPAMGFGGAVLATLGAGYLAAKFRSDGALAVALATGLFAPLAFSDGGNHFPGLLGYLLLLTAAQLAVHYLARTGGQWWWSRLLGVAGTWWIALIGATARPVTGDPWVPIGLAVALGAAVLVLAWLPRHPDEPRWAGAATVVGQIGLALVLWRLWRLTGFDRESFAWCLLGQAAVSLLLVKPTRVRVNDGRHDAPLLLLAAGFVFLAVPVALDERWVPVAWGVLAVALAWGARLAARAGRPETWSLTLIAGIATALASLAWLIAELDRPSVQTLMLNRIFVGGLLAGTAWGILALTDKSLRFVAIVALQLVLVNNLAWELAHGVGPVLLAGLSVPLGRLLATLVFAVTGAGLWFRGITSGEDSTAMLLRRTGYGWLAAAGLKLLVSDLARTELLFRALAALGVGAVFIGTALWANRQRKGRT